MMDRTAAAKKIEGLLALVLATCDLQLSFVITTDGLPSPLLIRVDLTGPDGGMITARNGEILHALESLATALLRLEPEQHDQISFEAEGFKAKRASLLKKAAQDAIREVRTTSKPYTFPPMNSRERRMLHLELAGSGLKSASTGEGGRRSVVLYPGKSASEPHDDEDVRRVQSLRSAFRPR